MLIGVGSCQRHSYTRDRQREVADDTANRAAEGDMP